ncbi:hypothetical protein JHK86_055441 [Glycine max]|nr:hypothetical protein JHK86_055441 [Glycine max]
MLSFSSPKSESLLVDKASSNATLPFSYHQLSSNTRNAGDFAERVTHSGSSIEDGQDKWCSATGVVAVHDSVFVCALCEELTRKAATLVAENENLKREKELALKEYESLETTNKNLKTQIAKSINTVVEKTPIEPVSSVAEITPSSGNGPWLLYNHFPIR